MGWSKEIKERTREKVYDGAMLKNEKFQFGFFCRDKDEVRVLGVNSNMGFPTPSDKVIATFTDVEAMIEAGWVID